MAILTPQAEAAAIFRKFQYYTINGKTAADLDKALSRSGPFLKKTGQHHPGAAEIRFDAKVRYGREPGKSLQGAGCLCERSREGLAPALEAAPQGIA